MKFVNGREEGVRLRQEITFGRDGFSAEEIWEFAAGRTRHTVVQGVSAISAYAELWLGSAWTLVTSQEPEVLSVSRLDAFANDVMRRDALEKDLANLAAKVSEIVAERTPNKVEVPLDMAQPVSPYAHLPILGDFPIDPENYEVEEARCPFCLERIDLIQGNAGLNHSGTACPAFTDVMAPGTFLELCEIVAQMKEGSWAKRGIYGGRG